MTLRAGTCLGALLLSLAASAHAQTPDTGGAVEPQPQPGPSEAPAVSETAPAEPIVAPPPSAAAAAADSVSASSGVDPTLPEMSEAELAELGFTSRSEGVDTSIRISGFADLGFQLALNDFTKAVSSTDRSFAMGNVNVYLNKDISASVRTMAEVRFLYLPNGAGPLQTSVPTNTNVVDYSDFDRVLRWGGIEIERVYLEWQFFGPLTLRLGQFLTPYGIWNVDHGTPTIIPAAKPYVIGAVFFPERQTGLELFGRTDIASRSLIGYHLTLSNGTGSVTEYKDLDKNKAVGARAYWEFRELGELRIGGSAYYGQDTNGTAMLGVANGAIAKLTKIGAQSDTLAFGVDALWKVHGFHLQAEWLSLQRKYTKEGRVTYPTFNGMAYPADNFAWGTYVLLGYRFDWMGVMPFAVFQNLKQPDAFTIHGFHFGLNIRAIDAVAIKLQFDTLQMLIMNGEHSTLNSIYAQVAWAF